MNKINLGLNGKRVVIIGGSTGIGLEIAEHFVKQGADLTITSHLDDVFQAKEKVESATGSNLSALKFDISDRDQIREAFEKIGRVDVLINNAGICTATPYHDLTDEMVDEFKRHYEVNVFGTYWCAQEAAVRMGAGGRIIFTGSIWARMAAKGLFSAYISTKHAVLGLVRSLACDLGEKEITVNAVCPGSIRTELNLRTMSEDQLAMLCSQMVLRPGLIPPEHLAGAFMFLASDLASEITGQEISVDRGQTIGGNQG